MIDERESRLQSSILADLESYGDQCIAFKVEKANKNGIPDIFFSMTCCGPCMVEAKKPGEKPSDIQKLRIEQLNNCGCKALVCDSWSSWIKIKSSLGIPAKRVLSPDNL